MRPLKQAIYSSRTADKFVVRLPDGMRERIAEVARNHHRSMNSEIIARLEQSLIQEGALGEELSMRLDSPELSLHERELLQRFRQLSHRQQNALVSLIAHDAEIAAVFSVPLDFFRQDPREHTHRIDYQGRSWYVPSYRFGEYKIWGLTAIMIVELINLLYDAKISLHQPPKSFINI